MNRFKRQIEQKERSSNKFQDPFDQLKDCKDQLKDMSETLKNLSNKL